MSGSTPVDRSGLPSGYTGCAIGGSFVVARTDLLDVVSAILPAATLHEWAAVQPGARPLQGRGVAWATRFPDGPDVVVRHSRHGGILAPLSRDLFLTPTRAPRELAISARLRAAGVATPELLAYAVYSVAGPFCRADVVTACVDGVDLATALREHEARQDRHEIRVAVSHLLESLWRAGAHHPDLNARNVLVMRPFARRAACVLDVDRVTFGMPSDPHPRRQLQNGIRLGESLRKLRGTMDLALSPNELMALTQFDQPGARATIAPRV